MREFMRFYFLKVILAIVVLQLGFFAWLQYRNHRPVIVTDEINVYEGQSVKFRPLRNDTDKDEDELSLQEISTPQHGKITQDEDILEYQSIEGFAGIDSFTYIITDGKKDSREEFIKVNVMENLKPTANDDHVQFYPDGELSFTVLGNDHDREEDSIYVLESSEPTKGKVERKGSQFVYTPNSKDVMQDSFHYIIGDGLNKSEQATVHITIKSKNDPCYPYLSMDIGTPGMAGNLQCNNQRIILKAAGNDIWGNSDNFHYAYQKLSGDCEMVTKVLSIEDTDPWAKAGIMIREELTGSSRNIFMFIASQNGASFQRRVNTGSNSLGTNHTEGIKAPYWVKLVRKENHFTGFRSADGREWIEVGSETIEMPETAYIGLAVTSHNNEKICTAKFDARYTKISK